MRLGGFLCLAVIASMCSASAAGETINLKHPWKEEHGKGAIKLISKYSAPVPFSTSGEPEATITVEAEKLSERPQSLLTVVKTEISQIKKDLTIAEYLEEDGHKPEQGIVSYTEQIDGHEVAFIKYRPTGVVGKPQGLPRTVIHAIFLKDKFMYFVHLIVLFAGHQDEVRADQIQVIRSLLRTKT